MGAEFADKYPKVASRLVLSANTCEDPHVERLLEAFAFLSARVHLKLDDDFPEITESLLNVLYPHYLRPMPSMTVAEFAVDPTQGKLTSNLTVPRHSLLYSRPVDACLANFAPGMRLRFHLSRSVRRNGVRPTCSSPRWGARRRRRLLR